MKDAMKCNWFKVMWAVVPLCAGTLSRANLEDEHGHVGHSHHTVEFAKVGTPAVRNYRFEPSVIRADATGTVTFTVRVAGGTPDRLALVTNAGSTYVLHDDGADGDAQAGDGLFVVRLPVSAVITGLTANDVFRREIGRLELTDGASRTNYNVSAQIWTPEIGSVTVAQTSATMQTTNYLVNLVDPVAFAQGDAANQATLARQFYAKFPDQFDFLHFVFDNNFIANRFHAGVKTAAAGIGSPARDATASYGSAGKLLGTTMYPNSNFFDGAGETTAHEIGHQWVNALKNPALTNPSGHWPLGTLASSVMGFSIPGSGAGGSYNCILTPTANGMTGAVKTSMDVFNSLDLYLMGLAGPESVADVYVFKDQVAAQNSCSALTPLSSFDRVSIADIIAVNGARVPSAAASQKSFRIATIVVSDTKLSAESMAFYDFFARRTETTVPTRVHLGLVSAVENSFFGATGGRASLNARVADISNGTTVTVAEFYARSLDHYFRTANADEANGLRNNPALGWQATGQDFKAYTRNDAPAGALPVCRFYGSVAPGPNSHFYTADAGECNGLRTLQATTPASQPRWNYEEIAFAIAVPSSGVCPAQSPVSVYRVYNNRAAKNDSNHRYTSSLAVYNEMIGKGWLGEGVTMCAPN